MQSFQTNLAEQTVLDQAAQKHTSQLEAAFQAVADGVIIFDSEKNFVFGNAALAKILGFANVEELKKNLEYFTDILELKSLSGEILPVDTWPISRVLRGESVKAFECLGLRRDTGQKWVFSLSGEPVFDETGKQTLAIVITRDITEAKRAQEKLQQSEKRYELASRATRDVIWDWDLIRSEITWNDAIMTVYGYDESMLRTKTEDWLNKVHPDDLKRIKDDISAFLVSGRHHWQGEYRFRRADGSYVSAVDRGYLVHDEKGRAVRMIGALLDVTEQREYLQAIENEREHFRAILEQLPVGVWLSKVPSGEVVMENSSARLMLKPPERPASDISEYTEYKCYHLDGRPFEPLDYPAARAVRLGETVNGKEMYFENPRGERVYARASATRVRSAAPEGETVVTVAMDISNLKAAESAARVSEAKFRTMTEAMPQMVWSAPPNGMTDFFNKRWYEFTGAAEGSTEGINWSTVLHDDDKARAEKAWKDTVENGAPYDIEFRIRHHSGEFRWVLVRALPVEDEQGQVLRWMGTCTDIHDQRCLREQLEEAQRRHDQAMRAAKVGTWDVDLTDGSIKWSDIEFELFGSKTKSPPQNVNEALSYLHPADRKKVLEEFEAVASGVRDYEIEFRVADETAPEGFRWISAKAILIRDAAGKPVRVVGTDIDVTSRKLGELESVRARQAAESANNMKSSFLANMSHEIRTPLGAILGFAELLRDPRLDAAERESYHRIIKRNGEQLSTLINDILDLSKIEAGQLKAEILPCTLRNLIEEVCSGFRVQARDKLVDLSWDAEPALPDVIGTDPTRLRQILTNLISNAIKFTDRGSILIYAKRDVDGSVKISVADTGVGISTEHAAKLFQPFTQADASITRKYGGTGLGLTLSKRLAQALGGNLVLESSKPGLGSVFALTLQNQLAPSALKSNSTGTDQDARKDEVLNPLSGYSILLVEDFLDNQLLITRILKRQGAEIDIASNGEEGVEKALNGNYDIVLMDIQMPEMDGYTAARLMRERGFTKPIFALTAHAMQEIRNQCLEAGFSDLLTKPIKAEELIRKLREV
jgi:PAS domain S-box-containing protein